MRIRHESAIAIIVAVAAASSIAGSSGRKTALELARRKDYAAARRAAAADTASLSGRELDETLLLIARLETSLPRAESLYRRVLRSETTRAAQQAALELAKMAYARGEYQGAAALLSRSLDDLAGRESEEAAYFRGLSWKQLGDRGRARAELSRITRGEYEPWSLVARAEMEFEDGRLPQAIELYERAARTEAHPVARFGLGECFERSGARDRALETYRDVARELPRSLEAAKANEKITLLLRAGGDAEGAGAAGAGERGDSRSVAPGPTAADRYTIQFGAFGNRANADAAARRLQGIVPAVRVESFEMDGRIWHRVRGGIYESRAAADRDLARAREKRGITGAVVPLK